MSYTYSPVEMKLFYPTEKSDRKIDRPPSKVRLTVEVDGVGLIVTQNSDTKVAAVWSIHAQQIKNWQEPLFGETSPKTFKQLRQRTRTRDTLECLRDFLGSLTDPKIYLVINSSQDLSELMIKSIGSEFPFVITCYQGERDTTFSFETRKKVYRVSKKQVN